MKNAVQKEMLKETYLLPKKNLRKLRLANEITTEQIANVICLSRRQYEIKEKGKSAFCDYEMIAIAKFFNESVEKLFFEN